MARLPIVGVDTSPVGHNLLNEFLRVSHEEDGTIKTEAVPEGSVGPQGAQGVQGAQGAQGAQGPAGPAGPQGADGESFQWRGEWDVATAYVVDDVVELDGTTYIAIDTSTGEDPSVGQPDNDFWDEFVIAGIQGPAGADGAAGPTGPQGPQGIQGPAGAAAAGAISVVDLSGFFVTDLSDQVMSA